MGKEIFWQSFEMTLDIFATVFCVACIGKAFLKIRANSVELLDWLLLALGIYIMISTGFTWWKLIGILIMSFNDSELSGILSGSILSLYVGQVIVKYSLEFQHVARSNVWLASFFLSASIYLLVEYSMLKTRDRTADKLYYSADWKHWVVVLLYFLLFLVGLMDTNMQLLRIHRVFGSGFIYSLYDFLFSLDLKMTGIAGVLFFSVLNIREMYYTSKND